MAQAKDYWVWQKPDFGRWRVSDDVVQHLSEQGAAQLVQIKKLAEHLDGQKALAVESELTIEESLHTSGIEGHVLDRASVRSAILKKLGSDHADPAVNTRHIDGLVESLHDAIANHQTPLSHERLHQWQASLFPTGRDERGFPVICGQYRKDAMRVITQTGNKPEVLHYVAPEAEQVPELMQGFISWFNDTSSTPSLVRAALVVFWFVSIHPYEDGNGRLCRLIGDLAIAQSQSLDKRLYSVSNVLSTDRKRLDEYYRLLESCQRCELDVTEWVRFFIQCVLDAGNYALTIIDRQVEVSTFWLKINELGINERQQQFFTKFFEKSAKPFETLINNKKYQKVTGTTAVATSKRDIKDLVDKGILLKAEGLEGRNTAYYANRGLVLNF